MEGRNIRKTIFLPNPFFCLPSGGRRAVSQSVAAIWGKASACFAGLRDKCGVAAPDSGQFPKNSNRFKAFQSDSNQKKKKNYPKPT